MTRRPDDLLSVEEARRRLARWALPPVRDRLPLRQAAGHVLAADARADRDLPPFDRAAVDGYAVRLRGPWREGNEFEVLGVLPAGQQWEGALRPGTAVKVMTGSPVPRGADGVVMVERSEVLSATRVRLSGPWAAEAPQRPGLAARGEDARRGAVVLARGTLLEAPALAVLASIGLCSVPVFRRPAVAILATGAEIVKPEQTPAPGRIRDANGPALEAMLSRSDAARTAAAAIVRDDFRALCRAIRGVKAPVLVLTGGVSAGDFDLVPDALEECGYSLRLHRLAIRPGKPLLFATAGSGRARRAVFGLPGNPVSVQVTAWEFLLPYLRAAAGWKEAGPRRLAARAAAAIERKPGLTHFVFGATAYDSGGDLTVREVRSHSSGDFVAAARADCLIPLPAENPAVRAGDICWIHPWRFGW